jgi:hypothetical protein
MKRPLPLPRESRSSERNKSTSTIRSAPSVRAESIYSPPEQGKQNAIIGATGKKENKRKGAGKE